MKKLFFAALVALMATMTSCSGTKQAEDKGAELKSKIENCTDPDSLKLYVEQAQEYAQKLIAEGKDKEAQAYLDEVTPAVNAKNPSLISVLKAQADSVATDLKEAASDAVEGTEAKAGEVKDSIASKGAKAVDAAKDAAKGAASEAAGAVSDAAQKGADKVKGLMGGK